MAMLQLFCVFLLSQYVVGQYTISCPKAFRIGTSQKVVLNLHNYQRAQVITTLRTQNTEDIIDEMVTDVNPDDINDPIELDVTIQQNNMRQSIVNIPENRPLMVNLEIRVVASVMTNGSNGDFEERITVFVSKDSGYLFVVTDLPVYKPDDLVRITVFTLDQEMRETNIPVRVVIQTPPDGIGIHPETVQLSPGVSFAEHQFNLGPNPVFGIWKVEATYALAGYETTTETEFKVEKFVLPTFEVNIELEQNFIVPNQANIEGTITANYSYGEPVYGNFYLSAKLKRTPSSDPQEFFRLPPPGSSEYLDRQTGSQRIRIPLALLNDILEPGETIESLFDSGATIFIESTVREASIGTLESYISPNIPFIRSPYEINKDRTSIFYNQGFVFPLKADVVFSIGKRPAPGVTYQVFVNNVMVVPEAGREDPQTDNLGQINTQFQLPGEGDLEVTIVLTQFQIRSTFTIYAYQSLSGNHLQINLQQNAPFAVGSALQITFGFLNARPTEIRYMILARGAVVFSGRSVPQANNVQSSANVRVSQSMVPSGRIVAYYYTAAQNAGSEIISNSLWFDVVDQCKEVEENVPGLTLDVPAQVVPAARATVRVGIRGLPRSLVHVKAVDRAAYFLFNNSRLTRDKMFEAMEDYDQGCIRNGGQNTESVFWEAGINLYSAVLDPRAIESLNCSFGQSRKKRQADPEILDLERSDENLLSKCAIDGETLPVPGKTCEELEQIVIRNTQADALPADCPRIYLEVCRNASVERFINRIRSGIGRTAADDAADLDTSLNNARTNFNPSMIDRTIRLNDQGINTIFAPVSHSISTFEVDGVSVGNTEDSFCVSETKEIRVFKDIFIQVFTPYSLRVREQANLRVAIFNYGRSAITIKLDVMPSEDEIFCTHFKPGVWNLVIQFTIGPRRSASTVVTVFPTNLPEDGTTEISFQARDSSDNFIYDQITKEVLIEQSGSLEDIEAFPVPIDINNAVNEQEFRLEFNFPVERVPGSRKCTIYAYSSFMGPTVEVDEITQEPNNVESIIRVPYGCGEQNMIVSGPNVYALMYLQSTGALDEAAYNAVVQKLEAGYQRELNYRTTLVNPRVFAVFTHYKPSTWLNAFVDKVFIKAKEYDTDLDIRPICDSLRWILTQQTAQGSFNQNQGLIHRTMTGAVGRDTTLTAYVVICLLETQSQCDPALNQQIHAAVDNAMVYLLANRDSLTFQRPFAVALLAYALALHQPTSPATTQIFNRLNSLKISAENSVHWEGTHASELRGTDIQAYWNGVAPLAVHIEATAYALLALITRERAHNPPRQSIIDETRNIALWLIAQRNSNGGFRSTQDTVTGLQALATYETWVNSLDTVRVPTDFTVSLSAPNLAWNHEFRLTDADFRLRKEVILPPDVIDGRFVDGVARGTGQGVVSYRCTFRTLAAEEPCDFNITEPLIEVTNGDRQREIEEGTVKREIRITFSVSKPGAPADMSIIEVGLMSGFVADEQTVLRLSLSDRVDGIIDRYEITNVSVILYVREITNEPIEISFKMKQEVLVLRPEPAKIKVYDYYETAIYCGLYYSLNENPDLLTTNCGVQNQAGACACAEGGCLNCRTRDAQLTKTACFTLEEGENCEVCNGDDCLDFGAESCRRNYVYEIVVTRIIPPQLGEIFFKFYANPVRVLREGVERVNMSNELEFVVRQDCFRQCQDVVNNVAINTINTGNRLLVMGAAPEMTVRNNVERFRYRLDDGIIEKVVPDRACNRYNEAKCRRPNADREKCEKQRLLQQSCLEYAEFARRLQEGFCENFRG